MSEPPVSTTIGADHTIVAALADGASAEGGAWVAADTAPTATAGAASANAAENLSEEENRGMTTPSHHGGHRRR
ncbi:MAG: hypothetical protein U0R23_10055 [Candidatus Nanopelagicales bacterium]